MVSPEAIDECFRTLEVVTTPEVVQGIVALYEAVAEGRQLSELLAYDGELDLDSMALLTWSCETNADPDDGIRDVVSAGHAYTSLAEDMPCLVPRPLIPLARNDDHHFLLLATSGAERGKVYYHDTEGQGGILFDDWSDLELVGTLTMGNEG